MRFICPKCGFSTDVEQWPFLCACSRMYSSATSKPTRPNNIPVAMDGSGTELKAMLDEIDAKAYAGCGCESLVAQMNTWGVAGCRDHRAEIAAKLEENAGKLNLLQLLALTGKAALASWVLKINPLDPYGSLVDEAVRRADVKSRGS